jgi:hypothetical protein
MAFAAPVEVRTMFGEVIHGDHLDVYAVTLRLLRLEHPVDAASDSTEAVGLLEPLCLYPGPGHEFQ